MSDGSYLEPIERGMVGRLMAERVEIWQMELLSASQLAHFSHQREVDFSENDIVELWQLGLLQADQIACTRRLRRVGLVRVGKDAQGRHLYADARRTRQRAKGWHAAAAGLPLLPEGVELYFHPFRYFVLYRLHRALELPIGTMQLLYYREGYANLVNRLLPQHNRWTASSEFTGQVRRWNDISALAAATEPCAYTRVYSLARLPVGVSQETMRAQIEEHWKEVHLRYQAVGLDEIKRVCQDLCVAAEMLDPNRNVHTLLRLGKGRFRQKIRGRLGGALLLLTMAEMLRRAAEETFDTKLREEDELGFGVTPRDMKAFLYGTDRILDGNRRAADEFMRQYGLDYSVRIRCYVEGHTEYGALDSIIGRVTAIDLVNVRGNIAIRAGKVPAWEDSLKSDLNAGVFSYIMSDSDKPDSVSAICQAAKHDLICGSVFISSPDFEFGNFTRAELEEILWDMAVEAVESGAALPVRAKLHDAIAETNSGKDLLRAARRALPELAHVSKGEAWGQRLMAYACEHPDIPDPDTGATTVRPLVQAAQTLLRSVRANYQATRTRYRVDPDSLKLVERQGHAEDGTASAG